MRSANSKRYPMMLDLPTVAEAGIPGFAVNSWCGVFVAGGTSGNDRTLAWRAHEGAGLA